MADLLPTNLQAILVQSLHDNLPYVFAQKHPFLDRMRKTKANGLGYKIPVMVSSGGGAGSTLTDALANTQANGSINVAFNCEPAVAYGNQTLVWDQVVFAQGEASAIDPYVAATKNSAYNCTDDLVNKLFGTGHGDRATIGTATSLGSNRWKLLLTNQGDARKFRLGMVLEQIVSNYSSIDSGEGLVDTVNDIEGSITVDVGSSGLTPTNGRHIGLQGELSVAVEGFAGVFGFVPPAASRTLGVVGDTFLGVVRTEGNIIATSGFAYSAVGQPLTRAVNAVAGRMSGYHEASPDTLFCSPDVIATIAQEMNQQVRYDMPSKASAKIFYAGFTIITPAGPVEVLAEPVMPSNQLLLTKASSWVFATPQGKLMGPATNGKLLIDDYDDNQSRVSTMSTGYFGCDNLAAAAVITIDPTTL